MEIGKVELSKNVTLIIVFLVLSGMKAAGFNSNVDDMLTLLIGAIIGKEVLSKVNSVKDGG